MALFSSPIAILEQGLQAAHLRHTALAQNLANINTPKYKAVKVDFEERLQAALDREIQGRTGIAPAVTHPRHLGRPSVDPSRVRPTLSRDYTTSARLDGNNVDVETESARLAANQLWQQALTRQISDEFTRLRLAITEGRR